MLRYIWTWFATLCYSYLSGDLVVMLIYEVMIPGTLCVDMLKTAFSKLILILPPQGVSNYIWNTDPKSHCTWCKTYYLFKILHNMIKLLNLEYFLSSFIIIHYPCYEQCMFGCFLCQGWCFQEKIYWSSLNHLLFEYE